MASRDLATDEANRRIFLLNSTLEQGDLVRADLATKSFTQFLAGVSATEVDFAGKTDSIAYMKLPDNTLWISRKDGSEARQITQAGMSVELPRWSPDGKQVAFMGKQPDRPWRIFVVSLVGGTLKEASQGDDNQGAPTWSLDGKFLAYGNVGCQEERRCAIHTVNLATGATETLPQSQGLGTARWSPNGKYIAALNPERRELYVFNFSRQRWRKLAENTNGNDLSWSTDSQYLYTNRLISGGAEILRVPVDGESLQTVLNLDSFSESPGRLDTWFSVTPENSIILHRWLSTSEIYALSYRN